MQFSSLPFLIWFVPVVYGIYYVLPERFHPVWLLAASLVFYGWASPDWLFLIGSECLIGYLCGRAMKKAVRAKKWIFIMGCGSVLALLFRFKYYNFFAGIVQDVWGADWIVRSIVLPAGISFYTFQTISYLADVWRGKAPAQTSFLSYCLYICMFFQLVAGPIVRYEQMAGQLVFHRVSRAQIAQGAGRFVCGLSKKVLLADQLARTGSFYRTAAMPDVLAGWIYALTTMLFIYYDFSGYTDMAIGLGKMMGYQLPENFDYPFLAGSFTRFWRRWHMSLTAWFRDYVYIPLGGSRKGRARQIFNLLVVWLCTGLWHGAAWNFVCWGLFFFVLLCLEKFVVPASWQKQPVYHLVVLLGLLISFVLFYDDSLAQFGFDLRVLSGLEGVPFYSAQSLYTLVSARRLLMAAILGCFPAPRQAWEKLAAGRFGIIAPVLQGAALLLCLAWLAFGTWSPFLYFRF